MDAQSILGRVRSEGVRSVRFLYCDHANIIRGKAAHASALADLLDSGIGLTVAMQGFCLTEHLAPTTHLGPIGEIRLVPDLDTFQVLPYQPTTACVLPRTAWIGRARWSATSWTRSTARAWSRASTTPSSAPPSRSCPSSTRRC